MMNELIEATGLHQQISQIPTALDNAGQQQSGLAAGFVQPLILALREVFKPEEMLQVLRQDLIRQLDTTTLTDSMKWYNSASGKSIIAAEQRLMQPGVMEQVGQAIARQTVPGLTPERKQLLQDLDQATQATDTALNMMMDMQAAFLSAFSQLITPDQNAQFDTMRNSFESSKSQYRGLISEQLLLQQAVLLEAVPDTALQEFHQFASSDSGRKLFAALNHSLDHTVRTAARKIPNAVRDAGNVPRPGLRSSQPSGNVEVEVRPVTPAQ
jgi:hypothetical protein